MSIETVGNVLTMKADAIMTLAMAAVLLLIGYFIKGKIKFLQKYCIPAPVVGGFLFMFITWLGHGTGAFSFQLIPTSRTPSCWPFSPRSAWAPAFH